MAAALTPAWTPPQPMHSPVPSSNYWSCHPCPIGRCWTRSKKLAREWELDLDICRIIDDLQWWQLQEGCSGGDRPVRMGRLQSYPIFWTCDVMFSTLLERTREQRYSRTLAHDVDGGEELLW
uniref:Uncharacterized protein n=1 Tax=Oryza meridionalis TaxID=40149 RepID=A0A0E0C959_9ORYZ